MAVKLFVVLCIVLSFVCAQVHASVKYNVASFEHMPYYVHDGTIPSRSEALRRMRVNIAVYKEQASKAAKQHAQIIVFPEDGLYGVYYKRDEMQPYLEPIPDPKKHWVPCIEPLPNTEILQELSCIALRYSMAVVGNMGDIKYCSQLTDPHCPPDGRYQYNTDVVFDTDGRLLARYHKEHLYEEVQFNTPAVCKFVTFVPSFGVPFGVCTCFDLLFKSPPVDLVHKYGVHNLILPTAWYHGFPVLKSILYHQGWSRTHCVNLITANIFLPLLDFTGSGIYACGEAIAYTFGNASAAKRLLVTTLMDKVQRQKITPFETSRKCNNQEHQQARSCSTESSHRKIFQVRISTSLYTLTKLDKREDHITICADNMCCHLHYKISNESPFSESFAFGTTRGYHPVYKYFKEVCVIFRCASHEDQSCGKEVGHSDTVFKSFEMSGNFSHNATVYPGVLNSGYRLSQPDVVTFDGHNTMISENFEQPLVIGSLFSRVYWKDNITSCH